MRRQPPPLHRRCAEPPSADVAINYCCQIPLWLRWELPGKATNALARTRRGGATVKLSGYCRMSFPTPHCNLPSGHAGHSPSFRPDKPPSLIIIIRSNGQFRAALEFDHEIPGSSHLSLSNHVTGQSDEMGSSNFREFWIEKHMVPVRDLKNRLGLHSQFAILTGQDCESRVEADTGNCLTSKV